MQILLIALAIWYFFFRKSQTAIIKPYYGNQFTTLTMETAESKAKAILKMVDDPVLDTEKFKKQFEGMNGFDYPMVEYQLSLLRQGFLLTEYISVNFEDLSFFEKQFPQEF